MGIVKFILIVAFDTSSFLHWVNAVVFRIRIGSHLYTQSGGFFSVLLHSALNLGIIRTAHSVPASTYPINSLDKRCDFAAPGDTSISEPAPDSM